MSTKRKRSKASTGSCVRPNKRAKDKHPVQDFSIELLPDEICLVIMAFLPNFEDRYVLGVVSKRWKSVKETLLKPSNDTLASEYLDPSWLTLHSDSAGPSLVDWTRGGTRGSLPACALQFYYDGKCLVQLFALHSLNHIHCCYWEGKRFFEIYRKTEPMVGPWILRYKRDKKSDFGYRLYKEIELPDPCLDGDIFDQVPRAKDAFQFNSTDQEYLDLLPKREEWETAVCFDPVLARRIYNFPYFEKKRQELEAKEVEYVEED